MTATIAKRGTRASLIIRDARIVDPAAGIMTIVPTSLSRRADHPYRPGEGQGGDVQVIDGAGEAAAARLCRPAHSPAHSRPGGRGRHGSGTAAAAAGGYVTICAMPNTDPGC